jgi:hypothetical protein
MAMPQADREGTRAAVRERLQAMLEGVDDAEVKVAAILALMRSERSMSGSRRATRCLVQR